MYRAPSNCISELATISPISGRCKRHAPRQVSRNSSRVRLNVLRNSPRTSSFSSTTISDQCRDSSRPRRSSQSFFSRSHRCKTPFGIESFVRKVTKTIAPACDQCGRRRSLTSRSALGSNTSPSMVHSRPSLRDHNEKRQSTLLSDWNQIEWNVNKQFTQRSRSDQRHYSDHSDSISSDPRMPGRNFKSWLSTSAHIRI